MDFDGIYMDVYLISFIYKYVQLIFIDFHVHFLVFCGPRLIHLQQRGALRLQRVSTSGPTGLFLLSFSIFGPISSSFWAVFGCVRLVFDCS